MVFSSTEGVQKYAELPTPHFFVYVSATLSAVRNLALCKASDYSSAAEDGVFTVNYGTLTWRY